MPLFFAQVDSATFVNYLHLAFLRCTIHVINCAQDDSLFFDVNLESLLFSHGGNAVVGEHHWKPENFFTDDDCGLWYCKNVCW